MKLPKGWGSGIWGQGDNGDTTFTSGSLSPSRLPPLYGVQRGLGRGPAAPACPPARAAPASGTHGRGNARGNVFIQSRGGQKIRQKIQLCSELSLPGALRGAAIFGVRPQGWGRRPQIILLLPGCCWFSFSSFFFWWGPHQNASGGSRHCSPHPQAPQAEGEAGQERGWGGPKPLQNRPKPYRRSWPPAKPSPGAWGWVPGAVLRLQGFGERRERARAWLRVRRHGHSPSVRRPH